MKGSLILGIAADLEATFVRQIADLRSRDPLAPAWVLVPNNPTGSRLRAALIEGNGAAFNVRFVLLRDLARFLDEPGSPEAPLPILDSFAGSILITRILREAKLDYLAPLQELAGTVRMLAACFEDLDEAGFDRFPRIGPGVMDRRKAADLALLYNRFREEIDGRFATEADLFGRAVAGAAKAPGTLGSEALFVYGFVDLNFSQRQLLSALADHLELRFLTPWEDSPAFEHAGGLLHWIREDLGLPATLVSDEGAGSDRQLDLLRSRLFREGLSAPRPIKEDGSLRIVSCPNEVFEARELLRLLLEAAEGGVPLREMAVAVPSEEWLAAIFEELATGDGSALGSPPVPVHVDGGLPASLTPEGKILLALCDLLGSDLERDRVMNFLRLSATGGGSGDGEHDAKALEHLWDRMTREAGIVSGPASWRVRIVERGAALLRLERGLPEAERGRLREALGRLREILDPVLRLWTGINQEKLPAAETLFSLGKVVRALVPAGEIRDRFLDGLGRILAQPLLVDSISPGDVPRIARTLTEGLRAPHGSPGGGNVHLVPLHRMRNQRFTLSILPGMLDRQVPYSGREDPLILDEERYAINRAFKENRLPLKGERYREQVYLFYAALETATERLILTFPRTDRWSGGLLTPSHFLFRAAEAVAGDPSESSLFALNCYRHRFSDEINEGSPLPVDAASAAVRVAIEQGDKSVHSSIALLEGPLTGVTDRRRDLLDSTTWKPTFTGFDGILGPACRQACERIWAQFEKIPDSRYMDAMESLLPKSRISISPTRLETYAACPRRYFFERVLRLEQIVEPAEIVRVSPLDLGVLIHETLRRAFARAGEEGLFPLDPAVADRLEEIMLEELDKEARGFQESKPTGLPVVWEDILHNARTDLKLQVKAEIEQWRGHHPLALEAGFGQGTGQSEQDSDEVRDPVWIDLGKNQKIGFHGRIDRVDQRPDGGLQVIDYKTGRNRSKKSKKNEEQTLFVGGTRLQLPVYLYAAKSMFPDQWKKGAEAAYFYNTSTGGFAVAGQITADTLRRAEDSFLRIVETIVQGIREGLFFPIPGEGKDDPCKFCAYTEICGPDIRSRAERKRDDPIRAAFDRMRGIA